MQQAAARAAGQMNARGLLNSSQAIGAGQAALYDAALPIAQADAAIQARAAEQTAAAKNVAELQRANIETSTSQFNVNAANTRFLAEADNNARAAIAKLQADTSLSVTDKQIAANKIMQEFQLTADLQKIHADGTIRQQLADTEASYKMLMQTSAGAADLYKQSIANFAAIIANPDIADKTAALNLAARQLNDALKLIGDVANMDLGSYLTFDVPVAAAAPAPTPTPTPAAAPAPAPAPAYDPFFVESAI
ncbi:MAG: hypothetical protein Q8Q14_01485 [Gemmatimonadales bacterium]|nr:hypothetical protein [Gemmatimonadales bacterium]